jgi:hypothetical protein
MLIKRVMRLTLSLLVVSSSVWASTAKDIEKANQKGQVAFILVTDGAQSNVDTAKNVLKDTVKQAKRSTMVELDRSNPDNADIVVKYKLASIPVPMVMVLNPNGVISGAVQPDQLTTAALLKMVPSPKKLEVMKALTDGNAVFITVSRKDMKSLDSVSDSCAAACQKASGKSVCVNIDMNDKDEKVFLTELKIDPTAAEPVTIVANPQGQIAAQYTGEVKVADLVTSMTKKVGGCCAPKVTGGASSCEPTKK